MVNVANGPGYGTISTRSLPTLVRNSTSYDMMSDKPLLVACSWLAQGFPHPCLQDRCQQRHPFGQMLNDDADGKAKLSINAQRGLIGNGMHIAAVGTWLLYTLACVEQRKHEWDV